MSKLTEAFLLTSVYFILFDFYFLFLFFIFFFFIFFFYLFFIYFFFAQNMNCGYSLKPALLYESGMDVFKHIHFTDVCMAFTTDRYAYKYSVMTKQWKHKTNTLHMRWQMCSYCT